MQRKGNTTSIQQSRVFSFCLSCLMFHVYKSVRICEIISSDLGSPLWRSITTPPHHPYWSSELQPAHQILRLPVTPYPRCRLHSQWHLSFKGASLVFYAKVKAEVWLAEFNSQLGISVCLRQPLFASEKSIQECNLSRAP